MPTQTFPAFPFGQHPLTEAYESYRELYGLPEGGAWGRVSTDDHEIFVQRFGPAEGERHLLFIHGYFDHTGTYGSIISEWVARGATVWAFDLPGHGHSSGQRGAIESVQHYRNALKAVVDCIPRPLIASVGHSTGGAVLVEGACSGLPLGQIRLVAPLLQTPGWGLMKMLCAQRMMESVPRFYRPATKNREFEALRKTDPLSFWSMPLSWLRAIVDWEASLHTQDPQPQQAVQMYLGSRDTVVSNRAATKGYGRLFPGLEIHSFKGAGHHLFFDHKSPGLGEALWNGVVE